MKPGRKVDIREAWTGVKLEPDAERDPQLADALRAMLACRKVLGAGAVRGAALVVDRAANPRPRVPGVYLLRPEQWGAEMAAGIAKMAGDVFVFVIEGRGRSWAGGLSMLYDGEPPEA